MTSMDQMLNQFKEVEEIRSYAEAQYSTILELSKKINKLEEENKHLKTLLENSTPILEEQKKELLGYNVDAPNEEIIAEIQLNKLKAIAVDRELTLEETKKFEIFSKVLSNLKQAQGKNKTIEVKADVLSTEDLLKLMNNGNTEAK